MPQFVVETVQSNGDRASASTTQQSHPIEHHGPTWRGGSRSFCFAAYRCRFRDQFVTIRSPQTLTELDGPNPHDWERTCKHAYYCRRLEEREGTQKPPRAEPPPAGAAYVLSPGFARSPVKPYTETT